jgi:hypothetical protein
MGQARARRAPRGAGGRPLRDRIRGPGFSATRPWGRRAAPCGARRGRARARMRARRLGAAAPLDAARRNNAPAPCQQPSVPQGRAGLWRGWHAPRGARGCLQRGQSRPGGVQGRSRAQGRLRAARGWAGSSGALLLSALGAAGARRGRRERQSPAPRAGRAGPAHRPHTRAGARAAVGAGPPKSGVTRSRRREWDCSTLMHALRPPSGHRNGWRAENGATTAAPAPLPGASRAARAASAPISSALRQ